MLIHEHTLTSCAINSFSPERASRSATSRYASAVFGEHHVLEFDDFTDIERLPTHHKDPFDGLLVVQAKRRTVPIVSADRVFESYGVKRSLLMLFSAVADVSSLNWNTLITAPAGWGGAAVDGWNDRSPPETRAAEQSP